MKRRRYFFFLLIPLFFGAMAAVVMGLWNAILPVLFPVTALTYWQALGLLVLCRILFGGFSPRKGGPPAHIREKWLNMDPEQKKRFKEEWRNRFRNRQS